MESLLVKYWAIILSLIAGVVWLVRLEGKVNQMQKELLSIARQRIEDISSQREARNETNRMIDNLANKIDVGFNEVKNQIIQVIRDSK